MIGTAIISLVSGLLTGSLPEIIKEIRETRASKREQDFVKLQHEMEVERMRAQMDMKIRESDTQLAAEEFRAMRDHLTAIVEAQYRPTGFRWIDALNALIRPTISAAIMVLFMYLSIVYADGLVDQFYAGKMTYAELDKAIWGSLVGEAIMATLWFLFGYKVKAGLRGQ